MRFLYLNLPLHLRFDFIFWCQMFYLPLIKSLSPLGCNSLIKGCLDLFFEEALAQKQYLFNFTFEEFRCKTRKVCLTRFLE